jgi:hypothetical protein
MAQQYDVSLKLLFRHSKGLMARRLFGGRVTEWINIEQPKVTNIRVDLLARMQDGSLRHVEAQARNEKEMARRQAEYYLGLHRLLGEHGHLSRKLCLSLRNIIMLPPQSVTGTWH